MRNNISASNNKNMKWVHVTYENQVRHINKGKFLTSHDPKLVEIWLRTFCCSNKYGERLENKDEVEGNIESITQSGDWETTIQGYGLQMKPEFVVDESYSGQGELDDTIQSWIDTNRVDITSIYATGHDPLEIQEFLKEHQEIFNKMVTRKTIYDLKEDEGNLYCSLRKLVGLENPDSVGSGRNTFPSASIFSQRGFYLKWKEKFEEVEETCEVT